jgi:hypothetical protein
MTEHLTRHSADQNDDFTARDGDVHEQGERSELRDEAGRADFQEPAAGTVPGTDHNLSTADLASASTRAEAGSETADATDATGTTQPAPRHDDGDEAPPLIDEEKITGFRDRWQGVQTGFVDDPQRAVREADELVAGVISALATTFAEHKSELEGQWQQGEPATEDLRIALRRYRAFFDQLLPH